MFGYIEGKLIDKIENRLILSTSGGIGLELYYKTNSHFQLEKGKNYSFFLSTIVRENQIDVYAHDSLDEKKFFELLLNKVKGVGPKTAYGILCFSSIHELCLNIMEKNEKYFKQIPGLGAKTSAQIILDLSKEILKFKESLSLSGSDLTQFASSKGLEVREALSNLGLEKDKIEMLLGIVLPKMENFSVSEIVRESLKEMRRQQSC